MPKSNKLIVQNIEIGLLNINSEDYICLTDMVKAKEGEFFVSDWLRNANTLEYLHAWEGMHNPQFNHGEFAAIRNQSGINSFKVSVKEWVAKTNAIGILAGYTKAKEWLLYADEADLLNIAMWGCTARDWKQANPKRALNGENIRDMASINDLAILSNIESLNSILISQNLSKAERLRFLANTVEQQRKSLEGIDLIKGIKKLNDSTFLNAKN
ncbi:KilA-N domain-containing protein [Dyadobacter alkalitolerans]|uniref:KilA-N domain-containing protein n=1 Tax=Dyadobacter alkalitolerans TaxID=492736 RepID=UPI00041525BC|nr:KilA-N domain-containing protein [Dyadobacter alkalitolerans]